MTNDKFITIDGLKTFYNELKDKISSETIDKSYVDNAIDAVESTIENNEQATAAALNVINDKLVNIESSNYATESDLTDLSNSLAPVATSGNYNDLSDTPDFKTINGESLLGSGDITVSGGSGADWNATEGEDGYIANRTHYKKILSNIKPISDLIEIISPTEETNWCGQWKFTVDDWDIYPENVSDLKTIKIYKPNVPSITYEVESFDYSEDNSSYILTFYEVDMGYRSFEYVWTITGNEVYVDCYADIQFAGAVKELYYYKLDEKYIPDTVLKTTPQTLSETDKNQVKKNLGITDAVRPNWNATEGEAGYIANKPGFYFESIGETAFYYDEHYQSIVWDNPSIGGNYNAIQILDYDNNPKYIDMENKTDGGFGNMDNIFVNGVLHYKWINNVLCIEPDYVFDDEDDKQYHVDLLNEYSTAGILVKIDEAYLPNTVLKTTPQSLTDAQKQQILENLGISGGGAVAGANVMAVDTGDVVEDVNISYATTDYVDAKVANIDLTNYATTAYVDGLVGDINSILESIING